jgi:hypothetical protein
MLTRSSYQTHHEIAAKGLLKDSGLWLLQNAVYAQWRASSFSEIFWLHGIPGCGKTKLVSRIIDSRRVGDVFDEPLAYFYCARDPAEPLRGRCDDIVKCLLRQLAALSPDLSLPETVNQKYKKIQEGPNPARQWTREESVQTIIEVLSITPVATIIIDALDECGIAERLDLLNILEEVMRESANLVKILISSRDDVDIVAAMVHSSDVKIRADDNAPDIKRFVELKVSELENHRIRLYGRMSEGLISNIIATLQAGAQGM